MTKTSTIEFDPFDCELNQIDHEEEIFPLHLKQDPFAAFIDGLGINGEGCFLYQDGFSLFTANDCFRPVDKHSLEDHINGIEVHSETLDLVKDIKDYYRTAMTQIQLEGKDVTPWRKEMLRVLDNCDNYTVHTADDWRILYKLFEFYHYDLQIDGLTRDVANASELDPCVHHTFKQVTPVRTNRGINRSDKRYNTFYLYATTQDNQLLSIRLSGGYGTQSLIDLIVDHKIKFDVAGAVNLTVANGTQVCYYTLTNSEIETGTIH